MGNLQSTYLLSLLIKIGHAPKGVYFLFVCLIGHLPKERKVDIPFFLGILGIRENYLMGSLQSTYLLSLLIKISHAPKGVHFLFVCLFE